MALPVGVTTATITFGVPVSFTGGAVRSTVSIVPSASLVHTATGTPLVNFIEDVITSEGVSGQFTLPHTDQLGFQDESGNSYQNWYYTATISYSAGKTTLPPRTKTFQLPTGQTTVDLDLLPAGAPVLPWTAATANVTSFHGRIGAVTVQDSDLPSRLSDASLDATYASLAVVERPQRFYAGHYATLADLFAARDATSAPAIIELEPSTTYQAANLRIDKPRTSLNGNKAVITLPAGAGQDALRIGPDAMFLNIEKLSLAGNYANQTGVSRGLIFEPYTGVDFRYSDRTKIEHVSIDGFKDEGAVIGEKRLHVVMDDVFIRDYGTIGLTMLSSDCRFLNGGLGGIRGQYGVKLHAGSNWVQSSGIWSNSIAGVWMTEKANGVKILTNDIDNNLGGGLRAVGLASDSLDASIVGNHFRGNSTSGDGLHSDIYLEQVSGISLFGNRAYSQLGSTARTKYIVEAGTGVASLRDTGNDFATAYPTLGRWNAAAVTARSNRAYTVDLLLDGSGDVQLRRQGAGAEVNADFTSLGTSIGQRLSANGTAGSGFIQVVEQSSDPAAPAANQARLFSKDNGSGKTQLCVRFATGAVQVISTEP